MKSCKSISLPAALLLTVFTHAVLAQNAPAAQATTPSAPANTQLPHPLETMVVLGAAVPAPLAESSSSVLVLPVESESLKVESPQDLLRSDASVFIEQRGAGGGQADLALRGGSFEQTLVLVNGFRVNDSQSAHHNLDLPIPLEAMDSIQILHGAGSTLHGVDALSGVVDFLTAAPATDSLRLRTGGGSFGANEESLLGALARKQWSSRLTASRNFSTGFMTDRDYRNEDASEENWLGSRLGVSDLLVAASDRSFGANQFYGPYDSWERTKGWFAAVRQELGARTVAAFGYRRHSDEFVLLREAPAVYENNHIDGSWQASLRRTVPVAQSSLLLFGLEADGDSIESYNFSGGVRSLALGLHARNQGAGYVDLDLRPAKSSWNLSAGLREEMFSGGLQSALAPHLAGSLRLKPQLKLRAAGGYGFRLPTYTDLYYSDPATLGNAKLKPELAWSGEGGADWGSARLSLSLTGFYNRQHDTIDYVRAASLPNAYLPAGCPANTWCATNLSGLHFAGAESSLTWLAAKGQTVRIAWTALHGAQDALHGLQSEYIFNYPVQNVHATWTAALGHAVTLSNAVQIAQRYQQTVYPVWNASLTRDTGRIRPYLRLSNLGNTGYQEIAGVAMPGRAVAGGVSLWLSR
jgi:iron complex outermembrane receptor protein